MKTQGKIAPTLIPGISITPIEDLSKPQREELGNEVLLRVKGDAMTAPPGTIPWEHNFPHGRIIHVDPTGGRGKGMFVVAKIINSGKVVFRQLESEEGCPILKALNPSDQYPIIRDKFEILASVFNWSYGGFDKGEIKKMPEVEEAGAVS